MRKSARGRPRFLSRLPLSNALLLMIVLVFSLVAAVVMFVASRYLSRVVFSQQEAYQASTLQIKTDSFERYLQQLETFSLTNAITSGDYPVVLVTTLIIAAAMLICSFMVDVLNALLDPRVRLGE